LWGLSDDLGAHPRKSGVFYSKYFAKSRKTCVFVKCVIYIGVMMQMPKHYYDIKYPYLQYSAEGTMCSVPPRLLAAVYKKYYSKKPKTFFDCGAATGAIVQMALDYGLDARGIDIVRYRDIPGRIMSFEADGRFSIKFIGNNLSQLIHDGRIQIKSILDCRPIKANLAYCNGVLTYFDESELKNVLEKFRNVKMVCAIHNTTEDYIAAEKMGQSLGTCQALKTVQSNDWWIETLNQNGFDAKFNHWLRCFVAIPQQKSL